MGKKKPSLRSVIDKMADGLCMPPGSTDPGVQDWGVANKATCLKKDEQRIYFALADLREDIDDLKRCMKALLHHNDIDYMDLLKAKRIG